MTYIDGYIVPVKISKKEEYLELATRTSQVLRDCGATRVVDAWQDLTPQAPDSYYADGTRRASSLGTQPRTFQQAAGAEDDEVVVYSWVEWPDKATRDKGLPKAMADPRMQQTPGAEAFSGRRLIASGFEVIAENS